MVLQVMQLVMRDFLFLLFRYFPNWYIPSEKSRFKPQNLKKNGMLVSFTSLDKLKNRAETVIGPTPPEMEIGNRYFTYILSVNIAISFPPTDDIPIL